MNRRYVAYILLFLGVATALTAWASTDNGQEFFGDITVRPLELWTSSSTHNTLEPRAAGKDIFAPQSSTTVESIHAASPSATSTLAGGLRVDTNALIVDYSSGRIGIGTTTPRELIEALNSGGNTYARLDSPAGSISGLILGNEGRNSWILASRPSNAHTLFLSASSSNTTGGSLFSSAKFAFTQNGEFGIGSTTPRASLGVQGNVLISGSTTLASLTATGTAYIANGIEISNGVLKAQGTATSTFGGGIRITGGFSATEGGEAPFYRATNTAATSTFAGGISANRADISNFYNLWEVSDQSLLLGLNFNTLGNATGTNMFLFDSSTTTTHASSTGMILTNANSWNKSEYAEFDGTDDYIETITPIQTNILSVTISAWIYPHNIAGMPSDISGQISNEFITTNTRRGAYLFGVNNTGKAQTRCK